ncbi:hypothetical protein FRC01_000417 [Tulasnella sp. 417]|nr:hypothetical protein FRC01_000417 [Tulasnella sp. 417]
MQSPKPLNKLESGDVLDKPVASKTGHILSLPNELLLRVISFLSTGAIRNLMASRRLLPLCEQGLYRSISLLELPHRSLRLLETFVLRPDLALLVQHLELDLECINPWEIPQDQIPSSLRPDGMGALSLAKNLRSFCLWGDEDWIWEPTKARYRETIFNMNLTRLEVPAIYDVKVRRSCVRRLPDAPPEWDGDLGAEIRKLLQTQPLLEDLALAETSISYQTVSSLESNLQPSDIPKLKSLEATPRIAAAFLSVASQLESLNLLLTSWAWGDFDFSKLNGTPPAVRLSIRRLAIRVSYSDGWVWSHFDSVLGLFPNTEELSVVVSALTSSKEVEHAKHYFDKLASYVYVLPSLRNADVRYQTMYPETPGILEVGEGSIFEFKTACPLLETLVSPKGEIWGFSPKHNSGGGSSIIGRITKDWDEWQEDLPPQDEAVA